MPINISFDTNTITDDEVRGIFALLDTVRPAAFDPGPFDAEEVTRAVEEKLSGAGISVKRDENGNIPTAENPDDFEPEASPIVELDADGKEWDDRIHSSSRAKNADGRWKLKRGVDKELVAQILGDVAIEDEADGSVTIPDLPTPPVYVTEEAAVVPTPPAAAPVPPPPPAPTADSGVPSFPDAVKICSALGKETYTKLFAEVGLKSVMEMRDDAALRERFFGHESVIVARMEKGV